MVEMKPVAWTSELELRRVANDNAGRMHPEPDSLIGFNVALVPLPVAEQAIREAVDKERERVISVMRATFHEQKDREDYEAKDSEAHWEFIAHAEQIFTLFETAIRAPDTTGDAS